MRLIKFLLIILALLEFTSGHQYNSMVDTYFYKRGLYPIHVDDVPNKSTPNPDLKRILQDLLQNLETKPKVMTLRKKVESNRNLNLRELPISRLMRMI